MLNQININLKNYSGTCKLLRKEKKEVKTNNFKND